MEAVSPWPGSPTGLAALYQAIRHQTEALCEPLETEDLIIQSMPEASPINWHRAHTTWFFETFALTALPGYRPFHPHYAYLFNSYYNAVGPRWPRPQRGLLSRPTVAEVSRYRSYVDEHMANLFAPAHTDTLQATEGTVRLGCAHEQQHQELILTDLKHAWSFNPLQPVYRAMAPTRTSTSEGSPAASWLSFEEGMAWIGHSGDGCADGFAFDNESPRHRVFVHGFQLASRLVTNGEYLTFLDDGGYARPELWLSEGWATRQSREWTAPMYWENQGGRWFLWTLAGQRPLPREEPVCHVSYYEADAFARWAGARLPSEAEWEIAAARIPTAGHFLESGRYHPSAAPAADDSGPLFQLQGDVWQWTASPYIGYPGYQPSPGALGEYNGKFMCNQMVLRGSSCVTPRSHSRLTYRNFFPPDARWQFSGIRLSKDLV